MKQGDLLYVLEQPPFQADLEAKQATVQQMQASWRTPTIALNRAGQLLHTPAGQQSTVDDARATTLSDAAQVLAAQAQQERRRSTWAIPRSTRRSAARSAAPR